jgi:hypothetical protein
MGDFKKQIDALLLEEQFYKIAVKTEPLHNMENSNVVEGPNILEISVPREEQRVTLKTSPYSKQLVVKVQELIQKLTNLPTSRSGSPDGKWGPMSARAWNVLAEKFNPSPTGPFIISSVNENGKEFPRLDEIKYVLTHPVPQKEEVKQENPKDIIPNISINRAENKIDFFKEASVDEHIFIMNAYQGTPTKEQYENMLNKLKSIKASDKQEVIKESDVELFKKVIAELISLSEDLENMGHKKQSKQIDNQISIYKSAFDELYNLNKGKKCLIEEAHPQGGFVFAPAKDEGGKIETVIEEQKKIIEQLNKTPDGKYAQLINNLVKMANHLEDSGNKVAAKEVDETIKSVYNKIPFVNRNLGGVPNSNDILSPKLANESQEWHVIERMVEYILSSIRTAIGKNIFDSNSEGEKVKKLYEDSDKLLTNVLRRWFDESSTYKNKTDAIKQFLGNFEEGSKFLDVEGAFGSWDKKLHLSILNMIQSLKKRVENLKEDSIEDRWKKSTISLLSNISSKLKSTNVQQLNELFKGKETQIEQILENELKKLNSTALSLGEYQEIYNYWKNKIGQVVGVTASLKKAEYDPLASIQNTQQSKQNLNQGQGTKAPVSVKKAPIRKKVRESNPTIQHLQEMLTSVTGRATSKSGKSDGIWGPQSAEAWNSFKNFMQDADLSPASISAPPSDEEINRAMRFGINYLNESKDQISFVLDGQEIYSKDLSSVTNLLAMLNRNFGLNKEQMHDDQYKVEVFNYLRKIVDVLQGEEGKKIRLYHGMGAFNALKNNLISLWQNISEYGLKNKPNELDEIGVEKSKQPNNVERNKGNVGVGQIDKMKSIAPTQNIQKTMDEIVEKYKNLPDAEFFATKDMFLQLAESKMSGSDGVARLPGSQIEVGRMYYNKLKKDVRDIIDKLTSNKIEIMQNYPRSGLQFYKDALSNIAIFDENLNYVVRKGWI